MIGTAESIAQEPSKGKGWPPDRVLRIGLTAAVLVISAMCACADLVAQPVQAAGSTELAEVFAEGDASYWDRTPLPLTGLATFYADGLMDYVHSYRLELGQVADCPSCVGVVALLRAGDIGRRVWLQAPGDDPVGPFLVVDCARREDYPLLLARGWAVDVSYELGQLWGMTAPLGGVSVLEDPADAAAGSPRPLYAVTPFVVPPGQVVVTAPTATPVDATPAPTPWPTRLPSARPGAVLTRATIPAAPTPFWPPPLTPIITTPTLVATPESTPPATPASSEGTVTLPTLAPPAEIALGRAGAGLLGEPTAATPVMVWNPSATPTVPVRTPRPDLTPILPDAPGGPPSPAPTSPSLLEQIWRALLEWVQP